MTGTYVRLHIRFSVENDSTKTIFLLGDILDTSVVLSLFIAEKAETIFVL